MQSFAIIEQLDVIKDFCPSLISGLIISMVNDLVLVGQVGVRVRHNNTILLKNPLLVLYFQLNPR
jgi:hypothetical protein